MARLKDLTRIPETLTGGHRLCAGCGASVAARAVLRAADSPVVVAQATGCLEVATTVYPYSSWRCSYIHSAFENAAATLSGVEAAYQALRRRGKVTEKIQFVAFAGDGGTYDIGLQSLSGAMERGHDLVYVCYDNEGYMNTGIQRSSATPTGAETTTTPVGTVIAGRQGRRKDMTAVMIAHGIPYVAQASIHDWNDLVTKAQKAFAVEGPAFLNVFAPCPRGWRHEGDLAVEVARLATETCYWPLFEVEDGKWKLTRRPREKRPLTDYLKPQGRFRHLFRPENRELLESLQAEVDRNWEDLLRRTGN
ncbi:MAG: thiamine pyrophosphate-dependent enzyme [Thermaerobacter sp.]|nr:thiamine pyrophosphate-dependent enzyme [Thermaerobacter sp.]